MITPTIIETCRNGNHLVGERVELGRYTIPEGERVVVGQRVHGVVRLVDVPADGRGRHYLIERELEEDGHAALKALAADYLEQAERHRAIPMQLPLQRYLDHLQPSGASPAHIAEAPGQATSTAAVGPASAASEGTSRCAF